LECVVKGALDTCVVAEIAAEADARHLLFNECLNYGGIRIEVPAGFAVMHEHLGFDAPRAQNAPVADDDSIG
jgi:hypothetical protein